MSNIFVGVDPGRTGAMAIINDKKHILRIVDWETNFEDSIRKMNILQKYNPSFGCIEKNHAMPKQGVVSMFTFGGRYYAWITLFITLNIPYKLVTPMAWQKVMLDSGFAGRSKAASVEMARRLYPDMIKTFIKSRHGRSDAVHLARYAQKTFE